MSDGQYSLAVAMLTAGGLVGALSAGQLSDRYGRRLALFGSSVFTGIGSAIMTCAFSPAMLMAGRFLTGIGSGVVTVVVPTYIAECAPRASRGLFGTLNQLAIVLGILVAQLIGLAWSTLAAWRSILALGIVLALTQILLLPFCVDSPRYLACYLPGSLNDAKNALFQLRGPPIERVEDEIAEWRREQNRSQADTNDPTDDMLPPDDDGLQIATASRNPPALINTGVTSTMNVHRYLTQPRYRRSLLIILLLQLGQQLSGINAVIFYSTSIMASIFPQTADLITTYISLVNLVMTIISAYLMDRIGRRSLFLFSASSMMVMSLLLASSITVPDRDKVSAFAIIGYVAAYAIGLGPIPFLMIPELVDTPAVSSAGAIGLASNMISNFLVSAGFLVVSDRIGKDNVFYLFSALLAVVICIAYWILPETKGRSADEVVRSNWSLFAHSYANDGYQPIQSPARDEA
ncbi:general substrate transporter [Syncephalastrum racemosum]|uniref:General substrate transporter n=1 Tax=Syncephalastrum racemosum TaxID=13706 RepID=A0A1X2H3K0_SYNRA|nr:general substrate transporter [Syncephalastrum racemosum]